MPKSRNNNSTTSSTTTTTITAPPTVLHLHPHQRQSLAPSSTSPTSHYIHNTSYGLLEPAQTTASFRLSLHHRRKSSSSNSSSSWSDRGFDLSELKDKSVGFGGRISEKLPGVRYSAAFISILRTNLALSASLTPQSSNLLAPSPNLLPTRSFSAEILDTRCLQHTRKMVVDNATNGLENIPDLTFARAETQEDKVAGLKLVADILSQQRSTASQALIYSPVFVALWAALVGLLYPFVYRNAATDKPNLGITIVGMLIFVLAGVRYLVKPYQDLAELINWEWLQDDEMVIARFGDTVIGTCVYRIDDPSSKKNRDSKRMLIRAWTTRPRERNRGVGRGTLETVVDIAKQKNCTSVEFAPDEIRVGSKRLLTEFDGFGGLYSIKGSFDEQETIARTVLKGVLDDKWLEKKTRGSR